jgi:hypothetical protein
VVALAASGADVVARVRALLAPAPRQRPGLVLAGGVLAACVLAVALHAQEDSERYFQPVVGATAPSQL